MDSGGPGRLDSVLVVAQAGRRQAPRGSWFSLPWLLERHLLKRSWGPGDRQPEGNWMWKMMGMISNGHHGWSANPSRIHC